MQETDFTLSSSGQTSLAGRIWLPDEPPIGVVCLVHGHGEHSGRYLHVAQAMTAVGLVMMAFDLRGHGRSGGNRGGGTSYELFMDDIQSLLDSAGNRYPGLPVFLYGHSLGANLVLNFALSRKPALHGVVATGAWLRLSMQPPAALMMVARAMNILAPGMTFKTGLDTSQLSRDPKVVADYVNDPLVHSMISARLGLEFEKHGEWALAHAAQFPLPLYLGHGGADGITSVAAVREFASALPVDRCTLNVYESLYHEIHNEPEQAVILADIIAWIQGKIA